MNTLTRWTVALAAALLVAHAAALQPVDGTEVVVTDGGGHQLVGYGVVKNGFLMLRMGNATDSFVMVLVAPDGSVQSFDGVRGAGGALLVDLPDGTRESLKALLGIHDVGLTVVHQSAGSPRAGAPGSRSGGSSASGGGDGSSGSDSSSSGDVNVSVGGGSSGDTGVSVDTGDGSSGDGTDGP